MRIVAEQTRKSQKTLADQIATGVAPEGDRQPQQSGPDSALVRFQILFERNARFRKAWDHRGYDLPCRACLDVLVQCAVGAAWDDASISALLVAHLARFGQIEEKSAIEAQIAKARRAFAQCEAIRSLELMIAPEPAGRADKDSYKALVTRQISTVLGLEGRNRITRIERLLCEPPEYSVHIAAEEVPGRNKVIRLPDIRHLIEQRKFRLSIADLTGKVVPPLSATNWQIVQQSLLDACVDVPVGEEATGAGFIRTSLAEYLAAVAISDEVDEEDSTQCPFRHAGRTHLFLERFRSWLRFKHGDRFSSRDLSVMLRRAGAEPVKVNFRTRRDPKRVASVRVWRLPEPDEADAHENAELTTALVSL